MLTSFAATGNPNDNVVGADIQNVRFDPVEGIAPPFKGLIIGEDLKFEILPENERLEIWNQLYNSSNTPLY